MSEGRTKILYLAQASDASGPAGDLLRVRLDPDRFAQVLVFHDEPGPGALRFQHAGAVVHSLGLPVSRRLVTSTLAVQRLVKVLTDFEADIAHGLDTPSSVLVALAGRIACVPILIGTMREHASRAPSWASRSALRSLDHLVTPSEAMRREVSRLFDGRHPPISVIPNAVDSLEVRGFARAPDFAEPRLRVGTCAYLAQGTGFEDLALAVAILRVTLPELEWLVSGTGPDAIRYLRLTQREGLDRTVRLLGERDDIGPFLASLDAYVSPSGRDAFPMGLLNALVAGVPCVAVSNPTIEAMLTNERDALLVPAGDPDALAAAIGRVLAVGATDLRATLRGVGDRIARMHSAAGVAATVAALYESLIERARERSN